MALVIDARNVADFQAPDGSYSFVDSSSIEFAAGTPLDAGSHNVSFTAPSVTIGANARLTTTGAVSITASKTTIDVPFLNAWSQVTTVIDAIRGMQTSVRIGAAARIEAGTFTITTVAGDDASLIKKLLDPEFLEDKGWPGQLAAGLWGQLGGTVLSTLVGNDIWALPFSFQWKQPTTTIEVGENATIVAAGNVSISGTAVADATGQAIYSVWANDKLGDRGGGFAAGWSYADAAATIHVGPGSSITAGGAFEATANTYGFAQMTSRVTLNQGLAKTNPNNVEVAYAGTYLESASRITVDADSTISAGKTVAISSAVQSTNKLKANTASYRDGLVGLTVGTGWTYGTSEVLVDGTILAGKVDVPRSVTFNPTFGLDAATGGLLLAEPTEFRTGDAIIYSAGTGSPIPGLVSGGTYHTIVDPQDARRVRLAASAADAQAGRAISPGRYPTLTDRQGRSVPVTSIEAILADTIWFESTAWPDGTPLFTSGQTVHYAPAAGQFIGFNDADGSLAGDLPAGDYVVRVMPVDATAGGLTIQLLPVGQPIAGGVAIDLNDNPLFRLADGSALQVFGFNGDSGQISFNFPRQGSGAGEVPVPMPVQTVSLVNGQPITYVEAFGCRMRGLEDGRTYYAIVDPAEPGVIRLALTASQAAAANPAIQQAVPRLETPTGALLDVGNIEPGTGLVFAADPGLAAGTAVVYRAAAGKPVGGLADGTTYYAYPLVNPFFDETFPQYLLGLRSAPDASLPLIEFALTQSLGADGIAYTISGVDAGSGLMAVTLPLAEGAATANAAGLTGGGVTVTPVAAGSRQVWANASGGTFTISLPHGSERVSTAAIPFNVAANGLVQAINALGLPGVVVTGASGLGTYASPWTLLGTGLDDLTLDTAALVNGSAWSRLTAEGLVAVATTASGGTFTLAFPDGGGQAVSSAPIPFDAGAAAVRAAVNGVGGLLAATVMGTGTAADPWLITARPQPIRTGDPLVFHDGWGSTSYGLVDGQTVYAIVEADAAQGKAGSLVIRLAASQADALAATPTPLPLDTTVEFSVSQVSAMSGTDHTLAAANDASGISVSAVVKSSDQQSLKAANGSEPKLKDILTRGDTDFGKPRNSSLIWSNILSGKNDTELGKIIEAMAEGDVNTFGTYSGSGSGLTVKNTAHVVLGSTAALVTPGTVTLTSSITENVKSNVEATVSKPSKGENALAGVSVAFDWVDVSNDAKTIVGAGASVTGGTGVVVDSKIVYPWAFQTSWLGDKWKEKLESDTVETLSKLFGGKLGIDEWFVNHWVNAGVKQRDFKDNQLRNTLAVSIAWVQFTNECVSRIEEGAQINQAAGVVMAAAHPVSVTAATDIAQTGFAGTVYIDVSLDNTLRNIRRNWGQYKTATGEKWSNSLLVAAQGRNAAGGSVGYFRVNTDTQAFIGGLETETVGGVTRPIRTPTAPLRLATGSGKLTVAATNSLMIVQLGQAGADASTLGVGGSAAVANVDQQDADAAIVGATDPARAAVIDAGAADVTATDTSYVIPIAGAVMVSKNKAVGVGIAIGIVNRDVAARVGSRDDEDEAGWLDRLVASGDVRLSATAGGAVTPSALAAASGSSAKGPGDAQANPAPAVEGAGEVPQGSFGLAVSGDYVEALVHDAVQATVNARGAITAGGAGRLFTINARNDTLIQATAGAAAFLGGDGSSLGLAGSAAVVTASSTVTAVVRQATVTGFSVDVRADNARRIGGLAASGSGSTAGNSGTTSVQVVGSVVVTTITASTTAMVDAVVGRSLGGTSVRGTTAESVWSAAGSFLFNFSAGGIGQAGQTPGKSLGIGAAVAVNRVTATTTAEVRDSDLEAASLAVQATDTSRLYTFSAGVVGTDAGSSASGMWAQTQATPTVTAVIDGGVIDVGAAANAAGGVDVLATSALLLVTAAGDLVIGRSSGASFVAAGAAVAVVGGTATTNARVGRSASVRSRKGNVTVSSRTRNADADPAVDRMLSDFSTPHRAANSIWTFAVGVVGSNANLSLAFSVAVNTLTSGRSAMIEDGASVQVDAGNAVVVATDEVGIYGGAGTIAVAAGANAKAAAGAAAVRSSIAATTRAVVDAATVRTTAATGSLSIAATGAAVISTAAVGGEVSTKAGVGTSLVINEIAQTVSAAITGTDARPAAVTTGGDVSVIATDRSKIGSGAGQVSIATSGVAAGAAAAKNTITADVQAVIERATVSAGGTLDVKADAAAEIVSHAIGVAGAWGGGIFSGVGSGTGNELVRKVLAAVRAQAVVEATKLKVTASDASTIDTSAGTIGILAGGKGVSAAVGTSVSTNTIGSTTDAAKKSFVRAVIEEARATVRGTVSLAAEATPSIQAITAAGAGSFSGGQSWGVNFAGAGAGSGNTIQLDAEAAVRGSTIDQPTGGDITITATNSPTILAVAGGVEVAGSGGGNKGFNVTVGAAATQNVVTIETSALVDTGAVLLTTGKVSLDAVGAAAIKAVSFGVAAALRGGPSAFDFTGAGSAALNTVSSTTLAAIRGTVGQEAGRAGSVSLSAIDRPAITAGAGGLSSAFNFGSGSGAGLSVGVSYTINDVSGSARALVDGGVVRASGDVSLTATFDQGNQRGTEGNTVFAVSVAGSVDASFGSGGGLFPLAGAGNRSTVAFGTAAALEGGGSVDALGAVALRAEDRSRIYSNAGGTGIGLSFAGASGATVAIGAAHSAVDVRNTVRAAVESANVSATGDVSLSAKADGTVTSVGFGVALSAKQAGGSASLAGSGAATYTTLANTIAAEILSSKVVSRAGDVMLMARDEPQVTSAAGAGALAVVIGNGVSLAPGVVILETTLTNTVRSRIAAADGKANPSVTAAGTVRVAAGSQATVSSLGVAVAAAATIGEFSGAFAGAGGHSYVTLANAVTAEIAAGSATGSRISVSATDAEELTKNTFGSGALVGGIVGGSIGVSLTQTTVGNTVRASVSNAAVAAGSGGISVEVRGGNRIATETVATAAAVAIGGAGAGGHAFSTDTSSFTATVNSGAVLATPGLLSVTSRGSRDGVSTPDGTIEAQAHGGAGGIAAVGVVIAKATDATRREATVGDGVDLSGVGRLALTATSTPNVKAHSIAVDVGGVAVTVNQSTAEASGAARAATGQGVTLPGGNVTILATGATSLDVDQRGVVGGALAAGATQSTGRSAVVTEALVGADARTAAGRTGSLIVRARSRDDSASVVAISGSGGLFAGFGTSGELTDATTTRAVIAGGTIRAGDVDVSADRLGRDGLRVDSLNITIGAGVGITRATYTAPRTAADGLDRVRVAVGAGTTITAVGSVAVGADHRIWRDAGGPTVNGVGGSVLVSGQQSVSNVEARVPATIVIGSRTSITSGTNPLTQPGGITIIPSASLQVADAVQLANLGLLVSGGRMGSYLESTVAPQVTMGDDVTLVSHGQINVGTTAFVGSSTTVTGWGGALFGGVGGYATANVQVAQLVHVGQRATFTSDGSLSVTPGDDPTGASSSSVQVDATARVSSYGILGLPEARARANPSHSSALVFGSGANVSSGGNMFLSARADTPRATATGEASGDVFGIPTTDYDGLATPTTSSTVTLAGSFLAGRESRIDITIPNDSSGGFTGNVQASPATVFGIPVASAFRYVPDFNPQSYIGQAGFSSEVADTLRSGVAQGPVGAIVFAPLGDFTPVPLLVSGGSVTITGDTISAGSASITARTGRITIRNDSPDYLVLGRMTIANVEGGGIHFRNGAGATIADPQAAGISRDSTTTPAITIEQTYAAGVGGSEFGPAVFLAQPVENMGGDVTIRNAKGSFGQTSTIAARRITIDTPNGVFAVDTPAADWSAAGTPAAQWQDQMVWPGGKPGRDQLNANQAVMYAINAMDSEYGTWRGVGSDDELNRRVYGDPMADRVTYVFFGGSTPQYRNDTNTQGTSEQLASTARPDGNRRAWRMTDKTPPLGKGDGWDHAWMPSLQARPSEFSSNSLPTPGSSPSVRGQTIIINAKTANINGTLEAGGDRAGDQSVIVPAGLAAVLLDFQRQYRLGEVTTPIYRIRDDQLAKAAASDRLIGATFDARTGQIVLAAATSAGGGSVSITGQIINTGGPLAGRIKVVGGSGNLTIRNETALPLVTGNLQTGSGRKQGVVSITNTLIDDPAQQQQTYVYDAAGISIYRGARGVDLPASGQPVDRVAGSTTTFQTRPDARWEWQLSASMSRHVNTHLEADPWPGVDAGGWTFDDAGSLQNPWGPWKPTGSDAPNGRPVFESNASPFVQRLTSLQPTTLESFRTPYQLFGYDTGFSNDHRFQYPTSVSLTMTMSLKADWPIGIDFSGTSFGGISVTSVGDIVVAGGTVAATIGFHSTAGGIRAPAGGGFAGATSLTVTAANGVGTAAAPLRIAAETVSGTTTTGGIWLDGRRGDPSRPVVLDGLAAPGGTVQVIAAGDLRQGTGSVSAAAASLASVAGGVGELSRPVVVAAQDGVALRLYIAAAGDVHVFQSAGDMLVGQIGSLTGSVSLTAAGSIFNGDTWTIDPTAVEARVQQFEALGATDPEAYRADVAAFERNVTSRYVLFWTVLLRGDDLDLWRPRTAAALNPDDPAAIQPTDDQIREYAAGLRGDLEAFFTTTVGPDWRSLAPFQTFDAAFHYTATPAQVEAFRKDRTVTADQLAIQVASQALDAPPPGQAVPGRANITGRDVTLVSRTGSVGKNDDPVTITSADLAAGILTPIQRQEIALAATPGDAELIRSGQTVTGVRLNVRRPLVLNVSGRLDVDAPAGIAVAQKTGDLRVGQIGSRNGLVSVIADGSILNAPGGPIDMWSAPVDFSRPADWTLVGNGGQSLTATGGLSVPGYRDSASGTWLNVAVPTTSFRVSFVYQATSLGDGWPGDGLAFVLAQDKPNSAGAIGGGLGYTGIPGPKAGFLVNVYRANTQGSLFDSLGTWSGGGFQEAPFQLAGRPVYVTLVYDAVLHRMTTTLSNQPEGTPGASPQVRAYDNVDLTSLLGSSAFLGFTTGTGKSVTSQQVTNFAFASGGTIPSQTVTLPATGQGEWVTPANPTDAAIVFTTPAGTPTATFAARQFTAAAAWYPTPVTVSSDFSVSFRYRFSRNDDGVSAGDGMAIVLQNSSAGTNALGGSGGGLGYAGIPGPKVGYLVNLYGTAGVRFDTTGSTAGTNPVGLLAADGWVTITLSYDARSKTMREAIVSDSGGTYTKVSTGIDLEALLGGPTAIFGFTAAAGAAKAKQEIQSLTFTAPPVPLPLPAGETRGGWETVGGAQWLANGQLTIPNKTQTATATWYERPVTTGDFDVSFTYEAQGNNPADGLAFVLQRSSAGLTAIGRAGGSLGYAGIAGPKVGVLFNIYGTPGVRFDTGGESGGYEGVPWLTGGPVDVRLIHDNSARTLSLTLSRTGFGSFSRVWNVDLRMTLGSQAFMGFTSGTGAQSATQTIRDFSFADRGSISSDRVVTATSPTVRLWSSYGNIGASGNEIAVFGRLQASAPNGQIHTNPPQAPAVRLQTVGGTRRDGIPVTNDRRLNAEIAALGNRVQYSTDRGRTWRGVWRAIEGLNDVFVRQVSNREIASSAERVRFVLDTKAPARPRLALADGGGRGVSRTGRLLVLGIERNARVEYAVNGGAWSAAYVPVEGRNVVRVRQIDLAGNSSQPTARFVFTRKSSVAAVAVALLRDTGGDALDRVTWDGRLAVRGVERGARVEYSTDSGASWRTAFKAVRGENRVLVRQQDRVGNRSQPTEFTFTLIRRPSVGARVIGGLRAATRG